MRVAAEMKVAGRGALLLVGEVMGEEPRALEASGARVRIVKGFEEARSQLAIWRPTLVLLDDGLAWKDLEATQAFLRACRDAAPVSLLVHDAVPTELLEACDAEGLADCLPRPASAAALGTRLDRLLGVDTRLATAPRRAPRTVALVGDAPELEGQLPELLCHVGYRVVLPGATDDDVDAVVCASRLPARADQLLNQFLAARSAARRPAPRMLTWVFDGPDRGAPGCEALLRKLDVLLDRAPYLLRAERRAPFVFPVLFREAGGATPGAWQSGYSWAVSPAGIFVRTLASLRPGVALEAVVRVTTSREELPLTGVVAWHHGCPAPNGPRQLVGFGLQFLGPPLTSRLAELIRLCTA